MRDFDDNRVVIAISQGRSIPYKEMCINQALQQGMRLCRDVIPTGHLPHPLSCV